MCFCCLFGDWIVNSAVAVAMLSAYAILQFVDDFFFFLVCFIIYLLKWLHVHDRIGEVWMRQCNLILFDDIFFLIRISVSIVR